MLNPRAELAVYQQEALPAPSLSEQVSQPNGYAIGPLDRIKVTVFGLGEISLEDIRVDQGGNISVPLVGTVRAAGLTPGALAANIEAGLRANQVRAPSVAVNVLEVVSRNITVEGEVELPGIFPVETDMTLLRAIALARGPTEFARVNEVLIFRTVGDQKLVGVYDLRALRGGTYEDPVVYANDIVVVGDSPSRRTFRTLVEGAALLSPLVYILR